MTLLVTRALYSVACEQALIFVVIKDASRRLAALADS